MNEIGYSRLVVNDDRSVLYYEKSLCTQNNPDIFSAADFEWRWSKPKVTVKKEQLSALHGIHRATGKKWWAWHGQGENQLHFSGEKLWWPALGAPHTATFSLASDSSKISLERLLELLDFSAI